LFVVVVRARNIPRIGHISVISDRKDVIVNGASWGMFGKIREFFLEGSGLVEGGR
jgi:hypothetical protein